VLLYEGEDDDIGGGVRCGRANWDDTRLGVADEIHGAKVVDGATDGLKKRGDEFVGRGEVAKVGPGKELEEEVVAIERCQQGQLGRGGCRQWGRRWGWWE